MAIEASINGIAFADIDGRLSYVNDAFLRIWGCQIANHVPGHFFLDFWQKPDDAAAVLEAVKKGEMVLSELMARFLGSIL